MSGRRLVHTSPSSVAGLFSWLKIRPAEVFCLGLRYLTEARLPGPEFFLRLHALRHPEAKALSDDERSCGFAEYEQLATRVGRRLLFLGLVPGERVAIFSHNRIAVAVVSTGILLAGLKPVAVNYRLTVSELRYILSHSNARGLFFEDELRETASEACEAADVRIPPHRLLPIESVWGDGDSVAGRLPSLASETPATIYTSGTTGKPKGAVVTPVDGPGFLWSMAVALGFPTSGACLMPCPLYHSAPTFFSLLSLASGVELRVMRKYSAAALIDALGCDHVTSLFVVPYMLEDLLQTLGEAGLAARRPGSLRALYCSAAPLRPEIKLAFTRSWGEVLCEFYGSTEVGLVSILAPGDVAEHADTVGRPAPGVTFQIIDPRGRPLPHGEVGQISVHTRWLCTHYHKNDDATESSHAAGAFLTGDLGSVDRLGFLRLHGRDGDMVISGGVNLYPAEVEAVLAAHPQISDVAVIGLPDSRWGEALHAVIVPRQGRRLTLLDSWCRRKLAGFKVPRHFHFVDELPRNPSGKVLKRVLRERLIASQVGA